MLTFVFWLLGADPKVSFRNCPRLCSRCNHDAFPARHHHRNPRITGTGHAHGRVCVRVRVCVCVHVQCAVLTARGLVLCTTKLRAWVSTRPLVPSTAGVFSLVCHALHVCVRARVCPCVRACTSRFVAQHPLFFDVCRVFARSGIGATARHLLHPREPTLALPLKEPRGCSPK